MDDLVDWVNRDAAMTGAAPVEGHTPEWHAANALRIEKMKANFFDAGAGDRAP